MIEYITTPIIAMFNIEMMLWNSSPTSFLLLNVVGILFATDTFFFNNKYLKRFFEFTEKVDQKNKEEEDE